MAFSKVVVASCAELDDAAVAEAEEEQQKEVIRETLFRAQFLQVEAGSFALYVVLVTLVTACARFSRYGEMDYYLAEMIRETLLRSEIHSTSSVAATCFENITTLSDIYQFLHGPLLAALYVRSSYAGTPLPPENIDRVNEHNILVGKVRLQQVRAMRGCAEWGVDTRGAANAGAEAEGGGGGGDGLSECEAGWLPTPEAEDMSDIVGADPALRDPRCMEGGAAAGTSACLPNRYVWSDATTSGIGSFAGWHATYDGSGYVVLLPSAPRSSCAGADGRRALLLVGSLGK